MQEKNVNFCCWLKEEKSIRTLNEQKLKADVMALKSERDSLSKQLQDKIQKLSKISVRNVNKRVQRQKTKVDFLNNELSEKKETIVSLSSENASLTIENASLSSKLEKSFER